MSQPLMTWREFFWILPRCILFAFALYYGTLYLMLINYPRRCS